MTKSEKSIPDCGIRATLDTDIYKAGKIKRQKNPISA